MNVFRVNFDELYRRHLCRHSQFGINILHLIAVAGIYVTLYGIVFSLPGALWIVGGGHVAYILVLMFNIPFRLLLVNVVSIAALLLVSLALPELPVWVYVVVLFVGHRFQVWQHKIYDKQLDMSEFAEKYRKGPALSALLAIYELPILLNFLVFDSRNRNSRRGTVDSPPHFGEGP